MEKIRVICLMPVKNEIDLLPITLPIISQYCDVIIVSDQMSDDGSREIYKKFSKVRVMDNLRDKHSNQVRWDLLGAAREYKGNNLILTLDADEYIPPLLFKKFLNEYDFKNGDSFRFPWIQLWKSIDFYNNRGAWFRNYQRVAWVDDGKTMYDNKIDVIDDLPRVPMSFLSNCKRIDSVPIIHLQWVSWHKTQIKQAWYKCLQLIHNPKNYISINSLYSHSLDCKANRLSNVPTGWTEGLQSLSLVEKFQPTWHLQEIYKLFDKHGILFFEPLQIWHITELEDEFIERIGRKPVPISESIIITIIKDFKRLVIKLIHY